VVLSEARVSGAGLRLAAALLALAAGAACGTATNYLDPKAPAYESRHAPPPPERPPEGPLRVVTFNIAYAIHVDAAIAVLREAPALQRLDVLALQEMDAPGVERIAEALALNSFYAPGGIHPTSSRDFGCALLSPWPLVEPRKVLLPHGARGTGLRRAAVGATLLRAGKRLRVYSVHLPSPFGISGRQRKEEVDALLADAADSPDPVVVAGDLNSHGLGARFVAGGYVWLTRDVGPTAHEMGVLRLSYDHVFAKGLRGATPGPAAGVVRDNKKASDHRPVWALLDESEPAGDRP
jgi:endonuclease/exonuclease/phosphatase family metal-dependent hydrolase